MQDNVIDARSLFIGKRLLHTLDTFIQDHTDQYHSFYLTFEHEGQEWLELCIKDLNNDSIVVVDSKPIFSYDVDTYHPFK